MDLIIKNLERLKDYSNGNHKPIERVVIDFDKLATEDFTQVFFDACEKYIETPNWEAKPDDLVYYNSEAELEFAKNTSPTLKEATERMQSEFDATGKDVKIFMNGRIIKK